MRLHLKVRYINNLYEAAINDEFDAFNGYARLRNWKDQDELMTMDEN